MSTIKSIQSAFGIGAAKVETILDRDQLVPGETINATVTITGGAVEQSVENVYLYLMGSCRFSDDGKISTRQVVFDTHLIAEAFTIRPNETIVKTAQFALTYETPISVGGNRVYIQTGLDIRWAFDPTDKDFIDVRPGRLVKSLFDGMEGLGFTMYKSDCGSGRKFGRNTIQEFEFKPLSGSFAKKLNEVELICLASKDTVTVYMQVDRRGRGLMGFAATALDINESYLSFVVTPSMIPTMQKTLYDKIAAHADKTFF